MPAKARKPAEEGDEAEDRKGRDWSHPEGQSLAEVDADGTYSGTITNVGRYGVFVNFGAEKDALLKIPTKLGRRMKKGMELEGMYVVSCEPEKGRVVMEIDEKALPELPEKPKQPSGGQQGGGGGAKTRSGSARKRKQKDWGHDGATALEDLKEGDVYEGTVTNVSTAGVFVDIGASRDVRLSVPAQIGRRFRIGDSVQDVTLERIDLETQRMSAILPDPKAAVADLPPKEKTKAQPKAKAAAAKPKAKGKAKGKAKAKSRARSASPSSGSQKGKPIEDFKEGGVVDGVVTNSNRYGVFVNIGCSKDAKLEVPKEIGDQFHKGDEVYGMIVDVVDLEKNQIRVSLDDPVLSLEGGEGGGDKSKPAASRRNNSRDSRAPASANRGAASPKTKAKAKSRASSAPAGGRYSKGSVADGVVTNKTPQGVFVDIGSGHDAILRLPRSIAEEFEVGDEVLGMVVEAVRKTGGVERVELSLEAPELEEFDAPAPPARKASAKGKSKASAKARSAARPASSRSPAPGRRGTAGSASPSPGPRPKAKAASKAAATPKAKAGKNWGHEGALEISEFEVGAEVDGIVTNAGNYGVFVDIGAVKDGRLQVSREDAKKFRKGDKIEGMVIEQLDAASSQITLALTFDLGDAPEEDVDEAPRRSGGQRSRGRN